jgi:hypothetical protein
MQLDYDLARRPRRNVNERDLIWEPYDNARKLQTVFCLEGLSPKELDGNELHE